MKSGFFDSRLEDPTLQLGWGPAVDNRIVISGGRAVQWHDIYKYSGQPLTRQRPARCAFTAIPPLSGGPARRSLVARQWRYVAAPIDSRYHNKLGLSLCCLRAATPVQKFGNFPINPPRTPSLRNGLARLLRLRIRDAASLNIASVC